MSSPPSGSLTTSRGFPSGTSIGGADAPSTSIAKPVSSYESMTLEELLSSCKELATDNERIRKKLDESETRAKVYN